MEENNKMLSQREQDVMLSQFRTYLEEIAEQIDGQSDEESSKNVDLFTLFGELAALKMKFASNHGKSRVRWTTFVS